MRQLLLRIPPAPLLFAEPLWNEFLGLWVILRVHVDAGNIDIELILFLDGYLGEPWHLVVPSACPGQYLGRAVAPEDIFMVHQSKVNHYAHIQLGGIP